MSAKPRFSDEFRIIPTPMKVIAALVPAVTLIGLVVVVFMARAGAARPDLPAGPRAGIASLILLVVPVVAFVLFATWILLVGYVYADSKRRGMSRLPWLLIVIFVPNALGFILYFVLRHPIPARCPSCGHPIEEEVAFCPKCGRQTEDACPACKHPVRPGDAFCSSCGHSLKDTPEGGGVPA
jgi:Double zinc ribbon